MYDAIHKQRARIQTPVGEHSRTKDQNPDAHNINKIMDKFIQTGLLPEATRRTATYGDNSNSMDLKASMDAIAGSHSDFELLSPYVRQAAGNDPMQLLEMLQTPEGVHDLQLAGLDVYDSAGDLIPPPSAPLTTTPDGGAEAEGGVPDPASPPSE